MRSVIHPSDSCAGSAARRVSHTLARQWSTEEVYLKDNQAVAEALSGLDRYFRFYNHERPHQALGYRTPAQVYGVAV